MNKLLRKILTLFAIVLTTCVGNIEAKNTIVESVLNDTYSLFEELITEGSKKTDLADRAFHQKFSNAKKSYLARYKKEIAPLISDKLCMPEFKLETMILNIDQFISQKKKLRNQRLTAQIEASVDVETKREIFGLTFSLGLFFAPYCPHGDLLLQSMPQDKQALQKGLWLFAFFQLLNTFHQKNQKLGEDLFSVVCDDPYSPAYPMVHGFAKKTKLTRLKKLIDTLEYGLCSMLNKVLKTETQPADWFYTDLKNDAQQWGATNLAKEIEAKCGDCCEWNCPYA